MSFWDHAEALRGAAFRCVAVLAVCVGAAFAAMPRLFDGVVLAPCRPDFPTYRLLALLGAEVEAGDVSLVNYTLASQFAIHMSASLWLGVMIALPMLAATAWRFVVPALTAAERRAARTALAAGCAFFYAGVAVAYFTVFPLTLRFLADYRLSSVVTNQVSLESYVGSFTTLLLLTGLTFELPLASWLMGRLGLLRRHHFARWRRHAVVALLVLAAVITPTGDPFTLLVVFVPLYFLWEISALAVPKGVTGVILENKNR